MATDLFTMMRNGLRGSLPGKAGLASPLLFVRAVLVRDWRFFAMTVVSCSVAATVATFQYAVYNSFRTASAVIPRAVAADFWVAAASVECFDFPAPFAEDYAGVLAREMPLASTRRVVFGFVPWTSPSGRRGNVALVGIEGWQVQGAPLSPLGFVANRSDLARLDLGASSLRDATIGGETLTLEGTVDSLATYVGAPYVIADFETARRMLRMEPTSVAFLAGTFGGRAPADFADVTRSLTARHPDIALFSKADFARSSADYWQNKTGAGLAIGLAAILAALLMVILLANGVLRFVQRYYNDLISLLGHGAARGEIAAIVSAVAVAITLVSLVGAMVFAPAMTLIFKPLLPWVGFSLADLAAPLVAAVAALAIALLSARRAILGFAPDAVFRT
jgi:hypothetical protein